MILAKQFRVWSEIDKRSWPAGPWQTEPDCEWWLDEATGLHCLILRNVEETGALCGYVGVTENHPFYQHVHRATLNVSAYGGLNFLGKYPPEITKDARLENVWWLGFDTAHVYDICPLMGDFFAKITEQTTDPLLRHVLESLQNINAALDKKVGAKRTYKTMEWMEGRVTELAAEIFTAGLGKGRHGAA